MSPVIRKKRISNKEFSLPLILILMKTTFIFFLRKSTFPLFVLFTTLLAFQSGCQSNSKSHPPLTSWNSPQNLKINTPYLIRTLEKNGMDAVQEGNPELRYIALARFPEYVGKNFAPLNTYIRDYVNEKIEDFADVMITAAYHGNMPENAYSETEINFIPFHYTSGFVSLLLEGYERTPAIPQGFNYYLNLNYDALNDQLFTLQDCLVGEEQFTKLASLVAERVAKLEPELTQAEIQTGTDPSIPENYDLFIVRPGEFMIFFHPYQLGPKIQDRRHISISFSELEVQPFLLDLINYHPLFELQKSLPENSDPTLSKEVFKIPN